MDQPALVWMRNKDDCQSKYLNNPGLSSSKSFVSGSDFLFLLFFFKSSIVFLQILLDPLNVMLWTKIFHLRESQIGLTVLNVEIALFLFFQRFVRRACRRITGGNSQYRASPSPDFWSSNWPCSCSESHRSRPISCWNSKNCDWLSQDFDHWCGQAWLLGARRRDFGVRLLQDRVQGNWY